MEQFFMCYQHVTHLRVTVLLSVTNRARYLPIKWNITSKILNLSEKMG